MSPRRGLPRHETDPARLLPLTPLAFSMLLALADRDLHGYAIARRIGERDAGSISLAPGNLYAAIDRLIDAGLVDRVGSTNGASDNRRGREYRITGLGRRTAALEAERLRALLRTARRLELEPDER